MALHYQNWNKRGSIIAFTLFAIAAMSVTAALLTTISIFEVRKSGDIERAVIARYKAETGIENSLFILNRSLSAGKQISGVGGIKEAFGFLDTTAVGESLECASAANIDDECDTLRVIFGVPSVRVNLDASKLFILNVYDPENKNLPPYNPFRVDKLVVSGLKSVSDQIEVTFVAWRNDTVAIQPIDPIKRIIDDGTTVGDPLDGSPTNGIAVLAFPCGPPPEDLCEMKAGTPPGIPHIIGDIRFRLLSPSAISGVAVSLYNGVDLDCSIVDGYDECIPGFVEVTSTGQDLLNKQALRVVSLMNESDQAASDIWDYVIFSNQSISK